MLRNKWAVLALFGALACDKPALTMDNYVTGLDLSSTATGGAEDFLTLPFKSGEYWIVTQKYEGGSHVDYGFTYGDDRFALDFAQAGCEGYGKPVTPMAAGTVYRVFHEGDGDQGYGNSVIVDHSNGFKSRYAHFAEIKVTEGEYVDENDVIGTVGDTGYVHGSACPDHPGTHLHVAFYEDRVATPPEPLSGTMVEEGCWYNREGEESCSGNPGDYTPVDPDDSSGDMNIRMVEVSPDWGGVEDDTRFVWATVVSNPDTRPDVSLHIYNAEDDVVYEFDMETTSTDTPYVFTYEKTLRDSGRYDYWIEAKSESQHDRSGVKDLEVSRSGSPPELYDLDYSPTVGMAGDTIFDWRVTAWTSERPYMTLHIVNPIDAEIYNFPMDTSGDDHLYTGYYSKPLNDPTTYPFWVTAETHEGASASHVGSIEVH